MDMCFSIRPAVQYNSELKGLPQFPAYRFPNNYPDNSTDTNREYGAKHIQW